MSGYAVTLAVQAPERHVLSSHAVAFGAARAGVRDLSSYAVTLAVQAPEKHELSGHAGRPVVAWAARPTP